MWDSTNMARLQRFLAKIRNTILQLRARTIKIWTAVAERSGDTAFRADGCFQKRRGASLPAAVQNLWLRPKAALGSSLSHPAFVLLRRDKPWLKFRAFASWRLCVKFGR
jgi:hypothetical protein